MAHYSFKVTPQFMSKSHLFSKFVFLVDDLPKCDFGFMLLFSPPPPSFIELGNVGSTCQRSVHHFGVTGL